MGYTATRALGIVLSLAGPGVPHPAMPGANDFVVGDDALADRPAAVQADVVHGGDGSVDVGDADHLVAERDLLGLALFGKVGLAAESDEVGHGKPAISTQQSALSYRVDGRSKSR